MEIRAYDEEYLAGAQRILGDAVDFAVMTLGLEPDAFGQAFAVSDEAKGLRLFTVAAGRGRKGAASADSALRTAAARH